MKRHPNAQRNTFQIDAQAKRMIIFRCVGHWTIFLAAALSIGFLVHVCMDPFAGWRANAAATIRSFGPALLTLACLMPIFVYDFLKVSNRIFGPVYRIRQVVQSLTLHQDVGPIRLREADAHVALVDDLNSLIEMLHESRGGRDLSALVEEPETAPELVLAGEPVALGSV